MNLQWASCQIRTIAGFARARNVGNVFPAAAGKRSRHAWRHVRDACISIRKVYHLHAAASPVEGDGVVICCGCPYNFSWTGGRVLQITQSHIETGEMYAAKADADDDDDDDDDDGGDDADAEGGGW